MLIPFLMIISLTCFPFFMYFVLKRLKEIRDILADKKEESTD